MEKINGNEIVLDIGQNLGIKSNFQFKGVNNDVLVKVTTVNLDHCIAKIIRGEKMVKPGLRLEEKSVDSY